MKFDKLARRELLKLALKEPRDSGARDAAFNTLEKSRVWEDEWEWRISTYGTERLERLADGFRASAEFNGRFRIDLATREEAWDALHALRQLGMSLFYALGWTTGDSKPSLKAERDRPAIEAYLKRLARTIPDYFPSVDEVRPGGLRVAGKNRLSVDIVAPPADWVDPPERVWLVRVSRNSLVLECECTTPERARLFLGVFDALANDLLEILPWKRLPSKPEQPRDQVAASARPRATAAVLAVAALTVAAFVRRARQRG